MKILVTLICPLFISQSVSQSAVFLKYHCTDNTHMHTQTSNTSLNTCEKTTRVVTLGNICMLGLFGLVLNLRHFNLFPGEELPDASSVVLIAQSVQEGVEGGRGLSQDGSHLQKGAARIRGLLVWPSHSYSWTQPAGLETQRIKASLNQIKFSLH